MYDTKAAGMRIKTLRKQFGNSREEIAGKIGRGLFIAGLACDIHEEEV
ncbi:MAG: hypothetical protein K2O34_14660 [Acetatifactor sp.]|nr:hypothetical protein [Acetatifactor sp.]